MKPRLLHIGRHENARMPREGAFIDALKEIGELTVRRDGDRLSDGERAALIRECNILLTMWESAPVPAEIARDAGKLEYICNITGGVRGWIPHEIIEAGIPVTNYGDAPALPIAEGAMALLLAVLKNIPAQVRHIEEGGWKLDPERPKGSLYGMRIGIYGLGYIGKKFAELVRPFGPVLSAYDPYVAEMPEGCRQVGSLDELFENIHALVVHAGRTPETERTITAPLLARLPDDGIVINTARGEIFDQKALFAELASGRLRAGLDVIDGEAPLPADHPARGWRNLILTAHSIAKNPWPPTEGLLYREEVALDNIRRHLDGRPLRFIIDRDRYLRST